jgi:3-hydroxyacyl-CoA dehydrogenase
MQDGAYNEKNRMKVTSPLTAGVMGAAIGATVAVVATVVLSDPQKRKKVEKQFQDMQKWGNKTLRDLKQTSQETTDDLKEEALKTAADRTERIQKEIDEAAYQAQQKTK